MHTVFWALISIFISKIVCNCVCLCTCVGAFLMQYCVEGGLVERLDGAAEAGWGGLAAGFSRSSRSGHCSQGSQALIVHCQCAHSAFFHCFFRKKTNKARPYGCGLLRLFLIPVNYPNHIRLGLEGVLERSGGRFSPSRFVAGAKNSSPTVVQRWPQYGWGKQLGSKSTKTVASCFVFFLIKNHRFRTH